MTPSPICPKIKFRDEEEKAIFEEMRLRVVDLAQDDVTIMRFLRAREHDLDKAEDMLRRDLKWRAENNISSYLHWRPTSPKWVEQYPMVCTGHDFEGSPVLYAPMGRWNTRERLEMGLFEDCRTYQYFMLENIMYHIGKSKSTQMVFIVDQAEISYWKIAHVESCQLFFNGFKTFEQHYPEILKKAIVINSGWLFSTIFSFVKPAFTGNTMSKIQIFGSDKEKYTKAMLEIMPEDAVPSSCLYDKI